MHALLQVDIDPFSEKGWEFTEASLRSLCERGGARLIRLDAFGYVSKKAGTTCFMQVRLIAVAADQLCQLV
jgi:sucrose phosphorylase